MEDYNAFVALLMDTCEYSRCKHRVLRVMNGESVCFSVRDRVRDITCNGCISLAQHPSPDYTRKPKEIIKDNNSPAPAPLHLNGECG